MNPRIPLLALCILVLTLAGCGSSESTTSGGDGAAAPEPLTKTELVAKADAICKDMQAKLDKIPAPENIEGLEDAISQQIKLSGPAIKKLAALKPPEDLASQYDAWIEQLNQLQAGTEDVRDAAAAGSEEKVQQVVDRVNSVNTKADELGKKLGFKACAK